MWPAIVRPVLTLGQGTEQPINKITVLVVEDEALLRMATVDDLTDMGLDVMEASNAREAIVIFKAGSRFECQANLYFLKVAVMAKPQTS